MPGSVYSSVSDRTRWGAGARGIVLAGRTDWSDSPATAVLRDPLARIALSPLISVALDWLRRGGIGQVSICASADGAHAIRQHLGDGAARGMAITYYADRSPRGAAGCTRDAALQMRGGRLSRGDTFVVVEGALIPTADLAGLLDAHREADAAATVVVDTDRRRSAVVGARPSMPGGVYAFDARAIQVVRDTGFQDIKEGLLERLYHAGERVAMHRVLGVSPRVLDYASYVSVNRWMIEHAVERMHVGYSRIGGGLRHHTARVHPSASIVGPVLIGPEARLAEGVVVIGPTVIGAGCDLAAGAVVARSVLWERCLVDVGGVVDAAVLVSGAVVGQGQEVRGRVELPSPARRPATAAERALGPLRPVRRPPHAPRWDPSLTPASTLPGAADVPG